jgi:hypothetical protein
MITRRTSGTTIEIGGESFGVLACSRWYERAQLLDMAQRPASRPPCSFEGRGWGANWVASYSTADGGTFYFARAGLGRGSEPRCRPFRTSDLS